MNKQMRKEKYEKKPWNWLSLNLSENIYDLWYCNLNIIQFLQNSNLFDYLVIKTKNGLDFFFSSKMHPVAPGMSVYDW